MYRRTNVFLHWLRNCINLRQAGAHIGFSIALIIYFHSNASSFKYSHYIFNITQIHHHSNILLYIIPDMISFFVSPCESVHILEYWSVSKTWLMLMLVKLSVFPETDSQPRSLFLRTQINLSFKSPLQVYTHNKGWLKCCSAMATLRAKQGPC